MTIANKKDPLPFAEWKNEFEKILMRDYSTSHEEIMSDEELEKRFYQCNESDPAAGVTEYADKYDLVSRSEF